MPLRFFWCYEAWDKQSIHKRYRSEDRRLAGQTKKSI
jgi:hypothetical protein